MKPMVRLSLLALLLPLAGCETSTEAVDPADPERILLEEDFVRNSGNWFTGTVEGSYRIEFLEGQYRLQSWNDSGVMAAKSVPISEASDFDIQVDLNLRDAGDDLGYGFCWGGRDRDNRACFFISRDGAFTVFRRTGGEVQDLVPWTASAWVEPARNTLKILKHGEDLRVYVNGGKVAGLGHIPFQGLQLAFAGDGKVDFGVDRVLIRTE